MHVDLPGMSLNCKTIPCHKVRTTLIPDIVLGSDRTIIIVELTVPSKIDLSAFHDRKFDKY